MAKRPSSRTRVRQLLDDLEPTVKTAFNEGVANMRLSGLSRSEQRAVEVRLEQAIQKGDVEEAARTLNVDFSSFRPLSKAIENVFEAGGEEAATKVPKVTKNNGSTAVFRFDIGNPSAAHELRNHSSNLITGIVDDQRQVIRDILADGIEQGRGPRRTALDLVGRINPVTGRREGGVIGLTAPQARYVENMRRRLLSGNPKEMEKVFGMERRDKRFDATIRKAIEAGTKLDQATVNRLTMRYSDRLLQLRGETIARTETMTAFNKGQMASMQQAISEGRVSASVVVKVWHAFLDERTRFTHSALNKAEVGFYDAFVTARGAHLQHPGDPAGGPSEIVCCRCWMETKIDFLADLD